MARSGVCTSCATATPFAPRHRKKTIGPRRIRNIETPFYWAHVRDSGVRAHAGDGGWNPSDSGPSTGDGRHDIVTNRVRRRRAGGQDSSRLATSATYSDPADWIPSTFLRTASTSGLSPPSRNRGDEELIRSEHSRVRGSAMFHRHLTAKAERRPV